MMMLINTNKIFEDAVNEKRVDVVENLLQGSDSKRDLIRNYTQTNCIQNLLFLLSEFKSKGLVKHIEAICTQHNDFKSSHTRNKTFKNEKKVYENKANKKINEIKHLRGSSFIQTKKNNVLKPEVISERNMTAEDSFNIKNITVQEEGFVIYSKIK